MKTFTEPTTRVHLYESGTIKTVAHDIRVKAQSPTDESAEVRLGETPYRIVMHCRTATTTNKQNSGITKQ